MDSTEKLAFFRQLVLCSDSVFSWCYRADGTLLSTNADEAVRPFCARIFQHTGTLDAALQHGHEQATPITLAVEIGLIWAVAYQQTESGLLLQVLGPIFDSNTSIRQLEKSIAPWEKRLGTLETKYELIDSLQKLPVISHITLHKYLLMLHYTITGETMHISDIAIRNSNRILQPDNTLENAQRKDRHRVWMAEHALLQNIRDGNIGYKVALDQAITVNTANNTYIGSALEQRRISEIIFITLCTRAAIDGGLSPDTAYTLGDSYIKSVQLCTSVTDLQSIGHMMYEDFILRVKKLHTSSVSKEIQSCCDYVLLHIEETLSLALLAEHTNYAPYYLARKFKKEMNCALTDYIKYAKIERAKLLLETTDLSIQQIADRLCLCSRTYLSDQFKKAVGCSPAEYRAKNATAR